MLIKLGDGKTVVPTLVEMLKYNDPEVALTFDQVFEPSFRVAAADSLGRIGPDAKAAIPGLRELLGDKHEVVRRAAVMALARIGIATIPTLAELLKDKNHANRELAALTVAEMGSEAKSLVPALTALLKDDSTAVRKAADEALYNVTKESLKSE